MRIPLFLSANPTRASRSGVVRLSDGEWVIASDDLVDTIVEIATSNDPFTILSQPRMLLPSEIKGPMFVVGFIVKSGTEKFFSVHASKVNGEKK